MKNENEERKRNLGASSGDRRRDSRRSGEASTHQPTREVTVLNFSWTERLSEYSQQNEITLRTVNVIIVIIMIFSRRLFAEKLGIEGATVVEGVVGQLHTSKDEADKPERRGRSGNISRMKKTKTGKNQKMATAIHKTVQVLWVIKNSFRSAIL
jgi:hypothetical protein